MVVPFDAQPGQVSTVEVPDLKLRLDGLKFLSERMEGKTVETKSEAGPQMLRPRTLAEFKRLTYNEMYAYVATSTLPAVKRLIEDGKPVDWEALRKNELSVGSLRWVVDELEKMERRSPSSTESNGPRAATASPASPPR